MKKNILKVVFTVLLVCLAGMSCSSAPKRSMQESTIYDATVSLLESANSNILLGDYTKAETLLSKAKSSAMSIDNYDLLTSVTLTQISLLLSVEPLQIEAAKNSLDTAYNFAKYSDFSEKQTALCTLAEVRIAIADETTPATSLSALLEKLEQCTKAIKGDSYNEANFQVAMGDIFKLQKDYNKANDAYTKAAKTYTDNRYLSEIGITWYKAAQVRSLAGNKKDALEAINQAIHFDRAAENSMALGADYYAKGVILLKGAASSEEKAAAQYSLEHSAQIYEAVGATDYANRSRNYKI